MATLQLFIQRLGLEETLVSVTYHTAMCNLSVSQHVCTYIAVGLYVRCVIQDNGQPHCNIGHPILEPP